MSEFFSLPFNYGGKEYFMLVRCMKNNECTRVRVTVMNGELEQLLCGNDQFLFSDGKLGQYGSPASQKCKTLKQVIHQSLEQHLCAARVAAG